MEVLGMEVDVAKMMSVLFKMGLLVVVYAIALPVGKKIIEKSLRKFAANKKASPGRMKTLDKLLANVYSYTALFILVLMLFSTIGVEIGPLIMGAGVVGLAVAFGARSEEHTSELQSRGHLVCRLLLEKKKRE